MARRPGPDIDGQPAVARVLAAGHAFNLPVGFFDPAGRAAFARDEDRVTIEFTDAAGLGGAAGTTRRQSE